MTGGPRFDLDRELGSGTTGVVWHGALREPHEGLPAGFELAVKYLHPALEKDARASERATTAATPGPGDATASAYTAAKIRRP